jgi:murein DD-endopeptidase MepM/ murein hydrolase activator NlpD
VCYRARLVGARGNVRAPRAVVVVALLAAFVVPLMGGSAAGEESLADLKARMSDIQAELDAATERIEELRTAQDELQSRLEDIQVEMSDLRRSQAKLEKRVVAAARSIYQAGRADMLEALFTAESFAELSSRAQLLSRVSQRDTSAFIEYSRTEDELEDLTAELRTKQEELADTREELAGESDRLQDLFDEVSSDYDELKKKLAAAAAAASQPAPAPAAPTAPTSPAYYGATDGMACPVAGPVSFVDSWHAPRAGHLHVGVDMMAAYGTPVVAIVDGTITMSSYGSSAGNWQILSGDNGHSYYYMHNQQNIVNGGHVRAGQQIATVGDTGNAAGTPHLHFEYHPGGGAPVNPYPLVASIC